jgi:catechol 2,3-dioxygenase-like lactoylglutathione lyase family enzyme
MKPVPPQRDLRGAWLDRLTGVKDAHLEGEHLAMPGHDGGLPTLEIYAYNVTGEASPKSINTPGLAHLAFEVDNVEEALRKALSEGGGQVGETVRADYPNGVKATFVYAKDIEGNIIELQAWEKPGEDS